ncbi:3-hydroxybutyrate oligomer hydrolase family protein [Pseudonocardia nematodicida]|uniref:3-hydroxybutyrate oligomer hydrolase family protein n=1 Tax=Pseudonocardia nematodicida TaxID=1206997 RepID=A0ABV1K4B1_9PSEU
MRIRTGLVTAALAATALVVTALPAAASPPAPAGCDPGLAVPGAERQVVSCVDDLTTTGTVASGHTVEADWAGLTSESLSRPEHPVPGVQVDGHFADDSSTNTHHGWDTDSQFVLRLPEHWNGGMVVSGSPGNRAQYAGDRAIADDVLARGYAFAATDKGNTGTEFHVGAGAPGDAVAEWNIRVTELTRAASETARRHYGMPPSRTLMAGLSNGGYLVRWQLENHPELYDGGVDWEGVLWRADGPNLLTFLPPALEAYPGFLAGDEAAADRIREAGFEPGSEFLWPFHHEVYWQLTQQIYREVFDPAYDGPDTSYDYAARPDEVRDAVRKVELTGDIGKPLITVHGTLDTLLPIRETSDVYAELVRDAGRGSLHTYHRVEGGTHTDGLVDQYPDRLVPLAPEFRKAVDELEQQLAG